jgi:porphobilinogen synthase
MQFPEYRARRTRRNEAFRRLVRETRLSPDNFVFPLFVVPGKGVKKEISAMPGQHNLSVDKAVESAREAWDLGIPSVLLFGIPEKKDAVGSEAWDDRGVVQKAVREINRSLPDL